MALSLLVSLGKIHYRPKVPDYSLQSMLSEPLQDTLSQPNCDNATHRNMQTHAEMLGHPTGHQERDW